MVNTLLSPASVYGAIHSSKDTVSRWCDASETLSVMLLSTDSDIKDTKISSRNIFFLPFQKENLEARKIGCYCHCFNRFICLALLMF